MGKLSSTAFTLARKVRDIEVLLTCDPTKIIKRFVIHKFLGKTTVKRLMK